MQYNKTITKSILLSFIISVSSATIVLADNKGTITQSNTPVNSQPSTTSPVVKNLNIGDSVKLLNIEGDFYKIAAEEAEQAFVFKNYMTLVEADATIIGDNVSIYNSIEQNKEQIATLKYGDKISVNGVIGDFYRINYNGKDCFVNTKFVMGDMIYSIQQIGSVSNKKFATLISESGVNLRKEASKDAEIAYLLARNSSLDVVDDSNPEWVKVHFKDADYFVDKGFCIVQTGDKPKDEPVVVTDFSIKKTTDISNDSVPSADSSKADKVISYAKKFLGVPYVWGGTNLNSGVDCSGFVYSVMANNGINLSRTSSEQYHNGTRVQKSQLEKGDLLFFDTSGSNNGNISHVGIYIGDGQFIHSSNGRVWGVQIGDLYSDYYLRTYVGATRVIQ